MARLIKIAETKDLQPGQGSVFEVEGNKIVVFNLDGRFYAVEDRFDREGRSLPQPATPATVYNVRATGNDIQLEL